MTSLFPAHRAHEGVWEGVYQHIDEQGVIVENFRSRVTCAFPTSGPVFYRQTTELWNIRDEQTTAVFEGESRGDHLWYDTATFVGKSWESNGIIMLDLDRKDEAGAKFIETIILGDSGAHRARTWHWFKDGKLYKRTLCQESRVQ